jgi:hypothetical protein
MTTLSRADMARFCDASNWPASSAADAKYSFGQALGDITGIGAIYNMGGDLALMHRNHRVLRLVREIDPGQSIAPLHRQVQRNIDFYQTLNVSLQRSILTKIAYIGTLVAAAIGSIYSSNLLRNAGLLGSVGLGAYFMGRAGFDSADCSMEAEERDLFISRARLASEIEKLA